MAKMGAPRKEIDYALLDKFCEMQCTQEEIANFFNIDADTLNARVKEEYEMTFSDYFAKKRGTGKMSLRRMQWTSAAKGNIAMQIFLGKNLLGQADKQEVKTDGDIKLKIKFEDEDAD